LKPSAIKKSHLLLVFIVMGFSAMISQIVLLRELVLFFIGNELTLGIILACWLLLTAIGSGWIGKLVAHVSHPVKLLIFCQLLLALLLPGSVVFIRSSRLIFSIPTGEMTSPIFMLIVPIISLGPGCIIIGFLYTLGCKLLSQVPGQSPASIPGRVFLFEAIGSGVAGFIASIILFRYFENFQVVTIISVINIAIAISVLVRFRNTPSVAGIVAASMALLAMIIFFPRLDRFSSQKIWGYLKLRHSETTIYGNIAVTGYDETISFYENGVLMFTHPDLMYAEESVHFALLEHPAPKKVLLIGGDAAASLPQILYHPTIQSVDFVLIDPKSIELARKFIPSLNATLEDPRINVWYRDGRLFLNQTRQKYDVIIINLPDPQTALINRFYTLEFYRTVRTRLNEQGILSFSITASENVLSQEQTIFLSCLHQTMSRVFADIVLIPGNSIYFIGCLSDGVLTRDPGVLIERLKQRKLPTIYMREYYIPFRMTAERMDYAQQKISQFPAKIINRDFRPIGYFYNIMLWLTYFNIDFQPGVKFLGHWLLRSGMLALIIIATLLWYLLRARRMPHTREAVLVTIMMIGFTEISLEVLIILGFQAIYGYAYYQLALIMSGFMIGLTLGSWYSLQLLAREDPGSKYFVRFQAFLAGYPLLIFVVMLALAQVVIPELLIQVIFLLLIVGTGFIGGFQFPQANQLIFQRKKSVAATGGRLYAADLFGSVFGALLASMILIPLWGLGYTCLAISLVNFAMLLVLWATVK